MQLGTEVGLGPGHIVLDGDPPTPLPKGAQPLIFGPCLLWPNGCTSQLLLSIVAMEINKLNNKHNNNNLLL